MFRSLKSRAAAFVCVALFPVLSLAAPSTDWTPLTDAIDFGTLAVGLLAAGAALVAVFLTIKGVKIIVGMVRS